MSRHDPETYEKMSEPYPGTESASAAIDAFLQDVIKLRKKHRIPNAVIVCEVESRKARG